MTTFTERTVGDLGEIFDGPHATPTRRDTGTKYFLNISSLNAGRLDLTQSDLLDDNDFAQWTRRVQPRASDLLFSYETRLGEAALMPADIDACLGRRMALLRPDTAVVHPRFLLYAWLSPQFQSVISQRAIHGATVQRIPLTELGSWPIRLPSLSTQKAIGTVLGSLDDKIAANRLVMASLDKLGRLIARKETAEGIDCTLLSVTTLLTRGVAPTYSEDGYRILNQKCVRNGRVDMSLGRIMSALPRATEKVLHRGDVLVNSTGQGTLGRVARWTRDDLAVSVDSHISIVRIDPSIADQDYVGTLLLDRETDIEALAEGTTGQTELGREALGSLPLRLPALDVQKHVGESLRSIGSLMDAKEVENEVLAAARDQLLPLLMSGKISVKDAEKVVEEI